MTPRNTATVHGLHRNPQAIHHFTIRFAAFELTGCSSCRHADYKSHVKLHKSICNLNRGGKETDYFRQSCVVLSKINSATISLDFIATAHIFLRRSILYLNLHVLPSFRKVDKYYDRHRLLSWSETIETDVQDLRRFCRW
jgi:hypothetical protein